jgi:hypothetical protein
VEDLPVEEDLLVACRGRFEMCRSFMMSNFVFELCFLSFGLGFLRSISAQI